MRVEASDGVELACKTVGAGDRKVVLIHGWMTSSVVFDALVHHLDISATQLFIVDLRGAGDSGRPADGYTLARFAEDVIDVIDHAELPRPVLIGHSMGGRIAQLVAAQLGDAVAGLMLVNPVPARGVSLPDGARELFRSSAADEGKQGTILDLACKQLDPDDKARMLRVAAQVSPACIEQAFDAWTAAGSEEHLARITAPTLVVATDDDFLPEELLRDAVASKIARARLAYLPGPGHYPLVEQPQATAALVEAFLAGLG